MTLPTVRISALIVEHQVGSARSLQEQLGELGCAIVGVISPNDDLVRRVLELRPDVTVVGWPAGEPGPGAAFAQRLREPLASPVVTLSGAVTNRELSAALEGAVQRHRLEGELADQKRLLRATLQSIGDGVVTTDAEGRITFLNPAAEALTEWRLDQALGRPLGEVVPLIREKSREPVDRAAAPAVARALSLKDCFILVTRSGREVPVGDSFDPILDAAGQRLGDILVFRDMTEKRAALRAAADLAAMVACSQDAIIGFTADGTIRSWNPAAQRVYGYTAAEMVGQSISRLAPAAEESRVRAMLERLRTTRASVTFETVRQRKDGSKVDVSIALFLIDDEDGSPKGFAAFVRDITELRQLQEQFRQAQKMESIGLLASGVAHDFNNLLTVIGGYSNLLMEELPQNDTTRETVQEIRAAGERAANLTRQLLAFSRKQVLTPDLLDLNELIDQSKKMFQRLIGEDILLRIELAPGLHRVTADLGQVEQVLMNLIVNARDAMPNGGRIVIATANEAVADPVDGRVESRVRLSVADTGCGMPPDVQARIFEPFFTTKGPDKGTGLGLAMVYGFVTQSGGRIAVSSAVGQGTTFDIWLPIQESGEPTATASEALPEKGGETLLVVEDDVAVRQFVCIALRHQGYTILEAGSGAEALGVAERHAGPIALLLTDVVMPEMSGRQLADALKAQRPDIKILFASGYLEESIARPGTLNSGENFLQKPFSPLVLAKKVRGVLDESP